MSGKSLFLPFLSLPTSRIERKIATISLESQSPPKTMENSKFCEGGELGAWFVTSWVWPKKCMDRQQGRTCRMLPTQPPSDYRERGEQSLIEEMQYQF